MKKLTLYILLLIFLSCEKGAVDDGPKEQNIHTDSLGIGWKKVLIGDTDAMSDIHFYDNVGFAVGGKKILKSIDGGDNWELAFQTERSVFNLSMGNANNIIAISLSGMMYCSDNGGLSFKDITLNDRELNEIFFIDDTTAFAIGLSLWKTKDVGKHWEKITEFTDQTGIRTYRTVHFINESVGWVISPDKGDSTIKVFKTVDGGKSWNMKDSKEDKFKVSSLYFIDEKNGFINAVPNTYRTNDGGDTWELIREGSLSGLGDLRFGDVHFLSKNAGYISDCKSIYKTINGGASFTREVRLDTDNADADIFEIFFTDETRGWACGCKGYILKYEK